LIQELLILRDTIPSQFSSLLSTCTQTNTFANKSTLRLLELPYLFVLLW